MRCNQFGCECCTCLECGNWKESCKCEAIKRAKEIIRRYEEYEEPSLVEAVRALKEFV